MLVTLLTRQQYYLLTGIFAAILFAFGILTNVGVTGFLAVIFFFLKFVPAGLAALSAVYYYAAPKSTDNADIDLGIGFVVGKTIYYAGVLASVIFAFFVCLVANTSSGGISLVSDLLSVYAVVVGAFTYANYLSYKVTAPTTTAFRTTGT